MNTAVLKINWFAALAAWLHKPAKRKAIKATVQEKPRVRIAGLR